MTTSGGNGEAAGSRFSLSAILGGVAALVVCAFADPGATAARAADSSAPVTLSIDAPSFASWQQYYASDYFMDNGMRCGAPAATSSHAKSASDCGPAFTNPAAEYEPGEVYVIPVVVHVIERFDGLGRIPDALIHGQIDVLNEDFGALAGSPGAAGYDAGIRFELAAEDPAGQPTSGITRTVHDDWFRDVAGYWNALAWDTSRYMNVYTNTASGLLGYVPAFPQDGIAGSSADRVVVAWNAFGPGALGGPPYDRGRTLTHEVGHYLGLHHTFEGGCAGPTAPDCYGYGDLICDTPSQDVPSFGCPASAVSCGSYDAVDNYMNYVDDACMEGFTREQSARMRCTLAAYRPGLDTVESLCGDAKTDPGESCDDGDTSWKAGERCRADCTALACGDPDGSGGEPTATDALFILRAAVGLDACDLEVCDVDGSGGSTTATDALLALNRAVGRDVELACSP